MFFTILFPNMVLVGGNPVTQGLDGVRSQVNVMVGIFVVLMLNLHSLLCTILM